MNCDVKLFETTLYTENENQGMIYKSKLGGGRSYRVNDLGFELKTNISSGIKSLYKYFLSNEK